eukprot:CAMPEP_0118998640 /NCGR_PEP_ID=MMETSP1173-20130426/63176_1 /TAXON_ID=1034831 /ORGANISM="Rhizochromulina marina cf, Strain CCMP1243" /LENGTH=744 /DNA_ID=CAMNT_0006950139 /DNA_START=10 /DNA_END=2244 /DNA_ORIENTATION=-
MAAASSTPSHPPPTDCKDVMASLRFGEEGPMEEALALQARLRPQGYQLRIISLNPGESIPSHVYETIDRCHAFIAFGCARYGEDTGNSSATHCEVIYWEDNCKDRPLIPVRMIGWDEQHRFPTGRRLFGSRIQLFWLKGTPLTDEFVQEVIKAIEAEPQALPEKRDLTFRSKPSANTLQNLPPPTRDFVGRTSTLALLDASLSHSRGCLRIAAITGPAGFGKSETALFFAHTKFPGSFKWLVRAETEDDIRRGYFGLLAAMDRTPAGELGELETADLALQVREALKDRDDWLLIFDNVPEVHLRELSPAGAAEGGPPPREGILGGLAWLKPHFLPRAEVLQGSVLFTTRVDWVDGDALSLPRNSVEQVPLTELEGKDGVMLLEALAKFPGKAPPSSKEVEARQELVTRLGGLPLALQVASSYCRRHRMTAAAYLRTFATTLQHPGADAVSKALGPTLAALQEGSGQEALRRILSVVAFLRPDDIPLRVLLLGTGATREDVVELCNMGLLKSLGPAHEGAPARDVEEEYDELFGLHRLVQEALRGGSANMAAAVASIKVAGERFDWNDASTGAWSWHRLVLPHLDSVLAHLRVAKELGALPPDVEALDLARLLTDAGSIRQAVLRDLSGAEALYREALEMQREVYGADARNTDIAMTLNNLGNVLAAQQKLEEAEAHYREALEMQREVYGADARNTDIAMTLNNLGNVLRERQRDPQEQEEQQVVEGPRRKKQKRPSPPPSPSPG